MNTRNSERNSITSMYNYDLAVRSEFFRKKRPDEEENFRGVQITGRGHDSKVAEKSCAFEGSKEKFMGKYIRPRILLNNKEINSEIKQIFDDLKKFNIAGDLNLNVLARKKNYDNPDEKENVNLREIRKRNLIPRDVPTFRSEATDGYKGEAHSDFIDINLANTFLLNNKESIGLDHAVITAYRINEYAIKKKVDTSKLKHEMYNGRVLNQVVKSCEMDYIGDRESASFEGWLETVNKNFISANKRIKKKSKLVSAMRDEGEIINDPTLLKKVIERKFERDIYNDEQREQESNFDESNTINRLTATELREI